MSKAIIPEDGLDIKETAKKKTEKVIELPKKQPFAYWEVDGVTYRLKLRASAVCRLESKLGGNLISILLDDENGIPPLATMLTVIQGAMQEYHHNMDYRNVQSVFDTYCEEGGSMLTLFQKVIMPLMAVSGFFTKEQSADILKNLDVAEPSI